MPPNIITTRQYCEEHNQLCFVDRFGHCHGSETTKPGYYLTHRSGVYTFHPLMPTIPQPEQLPIAWEMRIEAE